MPQLHVRPPLSGPNEWLDLVRARGGRIHPLGRYRYMVTCPNGAGHAHGDRTPSLEIGPGHSQPVIFKCHAGCTPDQVLEAEGLEWSDVLLRTVENGPESLPSRAPHAHTCEALHDYYDYVSLCSFSFLSLRCISCRRRQGSRAWLRSAYLSERWSDLPLTGGSHELVLPPRAGKVMWLVAADLVLLANHRILGGEYRPIPYSQRFGALRLDLAPSVVYRALRALEDHGVIENAGTMVDARNPFRTVAATPENPFKRAPMLWVLRVQPIAGA